LSVPVVEMSMQARNWIVAAASAGLAMFGASAGAQGPANPRNPPAEAAPAAPTRPAGDPAKIARGKIVYAASCAGCHGTDLRGGDSGGPNLLRSQVVRDDRRGELILPIVRGARLDKGMPPIVIGDEDVDAVVEYLHDIASSSVRPGSSSAASPAPVTITAADAGAGQASFAAVCSACHSPTGDLKGIGARMADLKALEAFWLDGGVVKPGEREVPAPHLPLRSQLAEKNVRDVTAYLATLK
jgi:cytochrome c oxidase cbb3-type subunit III